MDTAFKKNFLKGSAATTIGTVSSMLFHFFSIMIITRYLSKEEFGIYALVIVVVHLFNLLSGLGLEFTVVKFIASDNKKERDVILFPVLVLRSIQLFFISILFYVLSRLIIPLFGDGLEKYALLITILFAFTNFRDLFYNLLQGLNYFKNFAFVQVSSSIIRVALIGAVIFFYTFNLTFLFYIEILTTALAFTFQIFFIPFKHLIKVDFKKETYVRILKFSFPLYLNNLLTFTYDRIHFFILAAYLSPVSVALYDVANKVPEALKRMFQSFLSVFFPNISKLFSRGDKAGGEKLMVRSLSIFSLLIMFGTLIVFLFSKEITVLLFSRNYIETAPAFALLMIVFYLRVVSNIMGYSLVSLGYSSVPLKTNSISSIISVGGSLVLIPAVGFIGVVYALLGMNIVSQIYYHYFLKKAEINPGAVEYLKPAALFVILYSVYYLQPIHSTLIKIVFLLLYIVISWFYFEEFRKLFGLFSKSIKLRERLVTK